MINNCLNIIPTKLLDVASRIVKSKVFFHFVTIKHAVDIPVRRKLVKKYFNIAFTDPLFSKTHLSFVKIAIAAKLYEEFLDKI